jgi:hypothetical protein
MNGDDCGARADCGFAGWGLWLFWFDYGWVIEFDGWW